MKNRIAVDLGGTKTEIMLTEKDPLKVIERVRMPTGQEKGYRHIIEQIAEVMQDFRQKSTDEVSLSIGIPGTIDHRSELVKNSNTQCLIGKPLKRDLEELMGQQVLVENDANCFALAEAHFGAGKGHGMVLGVIMGTGFGGGIVKDGRLWTGLQGIAGEWGHQTINFTGPPCWCGRKGCVESYLSGTGFQRQYQELGGEALPLKEIHQRYLDGERRAKELFERLMPLFGEAMANLINCFDPDIIVIGGGVSNLPLLYDWGVEETRKRLFNGEMETPILPHQMGDSAGIYGAAMLAG